MICSLTNHLPTSYHSLASWRCSWSPGSCWATNRYGPWNCPESHMCVMCLATVRMFNKLLHSMMVYTRSLPHVGLHKRLLAWEKKKACQHPHQPQYHLQGHNKRSWSSGWYYAYILLQKSPWMQKHKHNHRKSDWCHIPFTIFWSWSSIPQSGHCAGDLIQPPATFTESQYYFRSWLPAFQQPTDTFFPKRTTMSGENILVYVYIHKYTYTVSIICMHGPVWSNIMQNLFNFHGNIAAWLAPALDGLQYRRQTLLKRVEGKWGKASFKMEVSIARFKRCQHRPQLWEELAQRAGGICSMCFMCEACSGSTKEVVLTLALPGGETLGSAEFLHLKSIVLFWLECWCGMYSAQMVKSCKCCGMYSWA